MEKPIIDAREVLRDIRSGMDDSALMEKYYLSIKGIQSLFNKLAQVGLIKVISPRELIEDIRAGMTNDALMEKYRLSCTGLECIFRDLDSFDLLRRCWQKKPSKAKITIRIGDIVNDIRSGKTELDLMKKYALSAAGLQQLLTKLASVGALESTDLPATSPLHEDTAGITGTRKFVRCHSIVDLYVCDVEDRAVMGMVQDINEKGVGVTGLCCHEGEIRQLLVTADTCFLLRPFSFKAICRWCRTDTASSRYRAGFEIIDISEESQKYLQDLMALATVTFEPHGNFVAC